MQGSQRARNLRKRDAWLSGQGFAVLRFWNNEVLGNLEAVLESVAGAEPD